MATCRDALPREQLQEVQQEVQRAIMAAEQSEEQLEGLRQLTRAQGEQLESFQGLLGRVPDREAVRDAVLKGSEGVCRHMLQEYKQEDDVRWQVGKGLRLCNTRL
jgi:hypothetical protein